MNKELIEALNILEKEKDISKESLFEAIENNLVVAYKNNFNKADNVTVTIRPKSFDWISIFTISPSSYVPLMLLASSREISVTGSITSSTTSFCE